MPAHFVRSSYSTKERFLKGKNGSRFTLPIDFFRRFLSGARRALDKLGSWKEGLVQRSDVEHVAGERGLQCQSLMIGKAAKYFSQPFFGRRHLRLDFR